MIRKKLTFLLTLLLIIAGCTSLPITTIGPALNQDISREQRQQQLEHIDHWQVKGRIAVRTPEKAGSADFHWCQQPPKQGDHTNYRITLFGVLGVSMLEIISSANQVRLIDSNNEQFTAHDDEELLYERTGWRIPIGALYYWIRGIAEPGVVSDIKRTFDRYNHLKVLKQQGWTVEYLKYGSVDGHIDLPTLIKISYDNLSVKLLISSWQI